MQHTQTVTDKDTHYVIDPITRAVTNSGVKNTIMQGDHNSERYTFRCPRYIEGHDMMECNDVKIYFVNTCSKTKAKSRYHYKVTDMTADEVAAGAEETIGFSWLIEDKATKYAGSLSFHICFVCEVDGIKDYEWNTDVCESTTVLPGKQVINENVNSLDISFVRGTSAGYGIRLRDPNGEALTLTEGQELVFGVADAKAPDEILLTKEITETAETGYYILQFNPEDTESMNCGDYLYDVSLKDGEHFYNIIEASNFKLRQNIARHGGAE